MLGPAHRSNVNNLKIINALDGDAELQDFPLRLVTRNDPGCEEDSMFPSSGIPSDYVINPTPWEVSTGSKATEEARGHAFSSGVSGSRGGGSGW